VNALDRWRRELAGWAIPHEILTAAPESPLGFPPELFRSRAERTPAEPSATSRAALDALGTGGDVLDVGVGGGATSLPLAAVATRITGVDESAGMLAGFLASAREAGLQARTVEGRWLDAGPDAPTAEVVVCGHVLYNAGELEPRRAVGPQRAQQLFGVVARRLSSLQDTVVGGELAFGPQLPDCVPDQWIEPIGEQGQPSQQLGGDVAPFDVRQLVQQNAVALAPAPAAPIGRDHQARCENSDHRWNAGGVGLERVDRPLKANVFGRASHRCNPVSVLDFP
jgi:SAM-dependent methyltransferase